MAKQIEFLTFFFFKRRKGADPKVFESVILIGRNENLPKIN